MGLVETGQISIYIAVHVGSKHLFKPQTALEAYFRADAKARVHAAVRGGEHDITPHGSAKAVHDGIAAVAESVEDIMGGYAVKYPCGGLEHERRGEEHVVGHRIAEPGHEALQEAALVERERNRGRN